MGIFLFRRRLIGLAFAFFVVSCLLMGRLFYLQVVDNKKLSSLAIAQRVQEVPVEVPRGDILDRNGLALTNTSLHYSVLLFPDQIMNKVETADRLAPIVGMTTQQIIIQIQKHHRPFKLKTDIDALTASKIRRMNLAGIVAVSEKLRYGYDNGAAHILGYINVSDNQGMSGIEQAFNHVLRTDQVEAVGALVDAGQNLIPGLGYKRMKLTAQPPPANVVLTIDSNIQRKVELVMERTLRSGAVVVLQPYTGEVLAMASRPNFNGNDLVPYLNRPDAPLMNRAISAFQPGSVFKVVVASAALEEGAVKPQDLFYDPGYIDVDNLRFKGWNFDKGGSGKINFKEAMAYSSNPVFIDTGLKIGSKRLIDYARRFGFGESVDIGVEGEVAGNLPHPEDMYPGDVANMSIGQGSLEATPLQVASMMATVVNDGIRMPPYLVQKLVNSDGATIKSFPIATGKRVVSRQTAQQIREMLVATTEYGTGEAAMVAQIGTAGKTGSAETGRMNAYGKGINHAWFAGYAPIKNPQYVIVVLVEEGMSGGNVAAPIFKEIVESIYGK